MRLDMRLMQRARVNHGLDLELAHRAAHEIAIGDRADELRGRRGNRIEADTSWPSRSSRGAKVWPSQPEEPVTRMRMGGVS